MVGLVPGFPQRLENLENENGHGKVMDRKNWPKVMKFCAQSWNFTNFAPKLCQICIYWATTKKLSSDLGSLLFPMFSAKRRECKIGKKYGHGKVMEKYFFKSVGTRSALLEQLARGVSLMTLQTASIYFS